MKKAVLASIIIFMMIGASGAVDIMINHYQPLGNGVTTRAGSYQPVYMPDNKSGCDTGSGHDINETGGIIIPSEISEPASLKRSNPPDWPEPEPVGSGGVSRGEVHSTGGVIVLTPRVATPMPPAMLAVNDTTITIDNTKVRVVDGSIKVDGKTIQLTNITVTVNKGFVVG